MEQNVRFGFVVVQHQEDGGELDCTIRSALLTNEEAEAWKKSRETQRSAWQACAKQLLREGWEMRGYRRGRTLSYEEMEHSLRSGFDETGGETEWGSYEFFRFQYCLWVYLEYGDVAHYEKLQDEELEQVSALWQEVRAKNRIDCLEAVQTGEEVRLLIRRPTLLL